MLYPNLLEATMKIIVSFNSSTILARLLIRNIKIPTKRIPFLTYATDADMEYLIIFCNLYRFQILNKIEKENANDPR